MRIMTSTDLIPELRQAGWVLDRVRGGHYRGRHQDRPGIVVVPRPKKELGRWGAWDWGRRGACDVPPWRLLCAHSGQSRALETCPEADDERDAKCKTSAAP